MITGSILQLILLLAIWSLVSDHGCQFQTRKLRNLDTGER